MRILDRQRYWSFLKAYVICYVSLVGLYIVIDAFSNLDEFSKRAEGIVETLAGDGPLLSDPPELVLRPVERRDRDDGGHLHGDLDAAEQRTARHAGGRRSARTGRFVRSWLRRSWSAGSPSRTKRSSCRDSPRSWRRRHDDDGQRTVHVTGRYDSQNIYIHGVDADRASRTLFPFWATIPKERLRLDPRYQGPAGDLYSAGPSDGSAEGRLAGAQRHRQPSARGRAAR